MRDRIRNLGWFWPLLVVFVALSYVIAANPIVLYETATVGELIWTALALIGVGANWLQAIQASNDMEFLVNNSLNGELLRNAKGRKRAAVSEAFAKGFFGLAGALALASPGTATPTIATTMIVGSLLAGVTVLTTRTIDRIVERAREMGTIRL